MKNTLCYMTWMIFIGMVCGYIKAAEQSYPVVIALHNLSLQPIFLTRLADTTPPLTIPAGGQVNVGWHVFGKDHRIHSPTLIIKAPDNTNRRMTYRHNTLFNSCRLIVYANQNNRLQYTLFHNEAKAIFIAQALANMKNC